MRRLFRKWLADWLRSHRREPARFRMERREQNPQTLQPDVIYQIGDDECVWAAVLQCPCGCREAIHLSLVRDSKPSWRIQAYKNGDVTLLPSVWRTVGCRSHFIIYRSRIIWCLSEHQDVETWW